MAPGSGGSSIGNQIDNYENSGGKMKESGAEVFSETYYGFGILFFFLM